MTSGGTWGSWGCYDDDNDSNRNMDRTGCGPSYYDEMDYGREPNEEYTNNSGNSKSRGHWGAFNEVPPPPSGYGWGNGFGPRGPPLLRNSLEIRGMKFLISCGLRRENLRNLPKHFWKLIDPQHCGICDCNLESFEISRAHYTSRDHMKGQRKFLANHFSRIPQSSESKDLKPRDVYCELCDVYITSEIHAESHYTGKMHVAIVKGKRPPKNPILHSKSMAERVLRLRRREKIYIRIEEKPKEEVLDPVKVANDYLFCNICKTSVTNSDQMKMHLNGKRHLSKEKQHILKVMKGEIKDKPEGEDKDNESETQEEDDDWADGSVDWEDFEQ